MFGWGYRAPDSFGQVNKTIFEGSELWLLPRGAELVKQGLEIHSTIHSQ